MLRRLFGALMATALPLGIAGGAPAQEAPVAYVVTYIEVVPAAAAEARGLLGQLRDTSRRAAGNVRFEAFHRSERGNHFAIVEAWTSQAAREAHAASAPVKTFREKLQPLLSAAYDERPHVALAVGPAPAPAGAGAVHVVTHVDVVPTFKDKGTGLVRDVAEVSRREPGALRVDALTQASRPNHMTLVESWRDAKAFEAHVVAPHTRKFREELGPLSGSLYDERLYTAID